MWMDGPSALPCIKWQLDETLESQSGSPCLQGGNRLRGGIPSCCVSLVMFQLVRAGPSTSKHSLSQAGVAPLPSLAPKSVAAPCNYACLPACLPDQGATMLFRTGHRYLITGSWALGLQVSTTKAVKEKKTVVFEPPQCLQCIGAVVRVDRTAGSSCNANKQTDR